MTEITTITGNSNVDYIQRDYNSVVDALVTFANVNYGVGSATSRLWSNFNANSFSRTWLELVSYMADGVYFYMDTQATEAYLQTANIRSSIRLIAKQFGYVPATATSASGDCTFTFTSPGTLSRGFRVSSSTGVPYYLTNALTATVAGQFTGTVLQGTIVTDTFTATGLQNEEFNLTGANVIVDDTAVNALDRSPLMTVNGNSYTLVESFIRNDGTDTPAITDSLGEVVGGGRVFQLEERADGTPFVRFGDNIFGRRLVSGETITVTYRTGGGTVGNVASGTVTTLVDSASFVTAVTNASDFSGGSDEQSLAELRDLIPASLRTLERAVSETDYSDLIISKFNEVSSASQEINSDDPGIDIDIYVVPQGNTITNITDNTLLLNTITDYVDRRKTVTVQFQILDAFGIQVVIGLEVFVNTTASRTTVTEAIQTALLAYFDLQTGGEDGAGIGFAENILLKDISNILQEIEGIERFEIKRLTYRPRIDKNIQGLVTTYNTSEVDTFANVEELEWLAAASGQQTETAGTVLFNNDDATAFTYTPDTGLIQYSSSILLDGIAPGDLFRNGPGLNEVVEVQTVGDGAGAAEEFDINTVADEQGIQEVFTIETTDDVGGDKLGTFFTMFDQAGSVGVWFTDGTTAQPSMGTNRALSVTITSNDDANTIAGLIRGTIDLDSEFGATTSGIPQVTEITTDTPGTITDGQYFIINAANDVPQYYAFYHNNNLASDPNVPGRVGIAIDINGDASADDVAESTRAALDALVDFSATRSTNVVTVTNADNGPATPASDVTVGGTFVITTPTTGTNANIVTVTNAEKRDLPDTSDGSVPTGFTFTTTVNGIDPDTLGGTYFDIADSSGDVRVWFDVDNTSSAPSTPSGGRLLEVDITSNDTSTVVASQLQTVIDGDAQFNASVVSSTVSVSNVSVGLRSGPTDGVPPTGFTFDITTEGADAVSIDGTFFALTDINGGIGFWFDVDDSGTAQPSTGQLRNVEINTVTAGMTDSQVAEQIEFALTSTGAYTSVLEEISQVQTVADVSQSLNNKYFLLQSANDVTEYYVWYDVDGNGTDPLLAGKTGIQVAISENDGANTVAATTAAQITLLGDFSASSLSDILTITNAAGGATTDLTDGPTPVNTDFTFSVTQQGATFGVSRAGNTLTVTSNDLSNLNAPDVGTSGFTLTVTQDGVANDTDFTIQSVDIPNNNLYLETNQPVNAVSAAGAGGSIRNGATNFESYKVFKKINATATNLSSDTITDSNLDLSVQTGTGTALGARILIDNTQVFVANEFATGEFYLIDGVGNVWEIVENSSNTITTSITAVNDASISSVGTGDYRIVTKLVGQAIVFNGSIFGIQYNTENTIISVGAQFTQIGTIGDSFQISEEQTNQGKLGISADLISFNGTTGEIRLNGAPDLAGVSSGASLLDSTGQIFSIIGVDNRALPVVQYAETNGNTNLILSGSGSQTQLAQGFQVSDTDVYSVVSAHIKLEGNAVGNLTARIVGSDVNGLPDVTNAVAVSNSVLVQGISDSVFEKTVFNFTSPPSLDSGVQYHLIINGDVAYNAAQRNNVVVFNNTAPVTYSYNNLSGVIQYDSAINLASSAPGNFFVDNVGSLFQITAVDDTNDNITIAAGASVTIGTSSNTIDGAVTVNGGSILARDSVRLSVDNISPSFASGEMSRFDNIEWSNSTLGGDAFSTTHDMVFTVEGPKSIRIDSNLTPVLGAGASISTRYYDDDNQVSFILGLSDGIITSASDVNADGKGTIGGIPNSSVDAFVFRTSRQADDIVNLRQSEIPQLNQEDISITIFGGVS